MESANLLLSALAAVAAVVGAGFGWWLRSGSAGDQLRLERGAAKREAEQAAEQLRDARTRLEAAEQRFADRERSHEALVAEKASLEAAETVRDARLAELTAERDAMKVEASRFRASHAALNTTLQKERADFEEQRKSVEEKLGAIFRRFPRTRRQRSCRPVRVAAAGLTRVVARLSGEQVGLGRCPRRG